MTRKQKQMAALGLGALGIFLVGRQMNTAYPKYPQAPPPPANNNKKSWSDWANQVLSLYGPIADLWQPGGPFYKGAHSTTAVVEGLLPDPGQIAGIGATATKILQGPRIPPGSRIARYWERNPERIEASVVKMLGNKFFKRGNLSDKIEKQLSAKGNALEISKKYNLGGVEFGNWIHEADRMAFAIALESMMEAIMLITGAPQTARKKLGKGSLVVAYGARGRGGKGKTLAFYQPAFQAININKNMGIGSFAHEYGHFLDFTYGKGWESRKGMNDGKGLMGPLFNTLKHDYPDYLEKMKDKDRKGRKFYLSDPLEIWARIFEAWVGYELHQAKTPIKLLSKTWATYRSSAIYPAEFVAEFAPKIKAITKKLLQS